MLGKKLELPNSQLQNIWVTLCSWIPGHTLCLAPTRSYWMFLSSHPPSFPFPGFPRAASPSAGHTPCPTDRAENIPKCPQLPGLSVLSQWMRRQSQTPEPAHRGSHGRHTQESTKQLHLVLNLSKTAQDEAQRAEPCRGWELLQPLTPSPSTSNPAGCRQQEGTGGHRRAQGPH